MSDPACFIMLYTARARAITNLYIYSYLGGPAHTYARTRAHTWFQHMLMCPCLRAHCHTRTCVPHCISFYDQEVHLSVAQHESILYVAMSLNTPTIVVSHTGPHVDR
jgi:hypothetical protein